MIPYWCAVSCSNDTAYRVLLSKARYQTRVRCHGMLIFLSSWATGVLSVPIIVCRHQPSTYTPCSSFLCVCVCAIGWAWNICAFLENTHRFSTIWNHMTFKRPQTSETRQASEHIINLYDQHIGLFLALNPLNSSISVLPQICQCLYSYAATHFSQF